MKNVHKIILWLMFTVITFVVTGCQSGQTAMMDIQTQALEPNSYALGWVLSEQAATAIDVAYSPSAAYRFGYRSDEGVVTNPSNHVITRLGTGIYQVAFENFRVRGGAIHVTAYGGSHQCKPWRRFVSSNAADKNLYFYVNCYDTAGNPVNGTFTALFYKNGTQPDANYASAYLLADNPTSPSYTPSLENSFHSRNGRITVTRSAVGTYQVHINNMGNGSADPINKMGGFLVTAFGADATRCDWLGGSIAIIIDVSVNCYGPHGERADSKFTLSFLKNPRILGFAGLPAGYALAHSPFPDPGLQSGGMTREQLGTGNYLMHTPFIGGSGVKDTVQVSTSALGNARCSVMSWSPAWDTDPEIEVNVKCYDYASNPVNSTFWLLYHSNGSQGSLRVRVLGAPVGKAKVLVTGPGGFNSGVFNLHRVFSDLTSGGYFVAANGFMLGRPGDPTCRVYTPVIDDSDPTVVAGQITTVTVTHETETCN